MIVIGKGGKDKFIIEADGDELAKIFGSPYLSTSNRNLDVGSTIDVSERYNGINAAASLPDDIRKLRTEFNRVEAQLKRMEKLAESTTFVAVKKLTT